MFLKTPTANYEKTCQPEKGISNHITNLHFQMAILKYYSDNVRICFSVHKNEFLKKSVLGGFHKLRKNVFWIFDPIPH